MLKRLIRISNNLKIKHKLLISYVLVVMIPVLIIGLAVTGYFRQQALDNAIGQTIINVDKIKSQTATMLRVPTDISNMLMFNTDLKEIVNRRYKSVVELTSAYLAYKDFQEYRRLYREVAGIRFYSTNPTLINNLEFIPVNERTQESYWYKEALKTTSIGWFYIPGKEDNPVHRLSLVRKVPFAEYKTEGVLMIVINQEELNGLLRQEQFETLITDEQGYVVAAKNTELVGKTLDELDFGVDLQSQPKGTIEADFQGEPSNIVIDELGPGSSFNKLKVISVFATKNIVKDANQISQIGMIFITLVLVIALLLVYIISFLTSNRLLRLSKHLNKLALGDLNVTSRIDGNDEIGQLSRQFNYMVKSINELMTQVVETTEQNNQLEIAQKEIKLKMMASQINPHFLFNALESIRMKAHIKGEAEIANIVRLLGKLMRKSLEIGSGKTTFRAELEMVRSYLEIQKFRYGDRLAFEIHLDAAVEKMSIPPLIIQPIVENAIVHGLENKEGQVQVHIHICMQDGMVRVKVKDDGAGITPERLAEVLQFVSGPEEEERSRIGMRNVHQRLTLTYGESAGLQINSVYGEGTEVSFTLPAGGNQHV
ncbi:sensor histidine kinase [Paenibacillus barcinonensis]|uniref:Sensor histidine kinase n=1 Tax=Paenibacillus barcinonensis TaxID=198119 RepID=A0A2V4VM93_PAEBA|nr:histidine kinase [Paenibacillus barcinonensis]PYE45860.1 two-component system sensor histidine kinase YesM [Paenibacillus barcinonensis]QKS57132.1 sensor histidine kinase [Paenibacillus barcinonensis]